MDRSASSLRCMGAVLAGGASARMGTDKAFIEIEGAPMVARAVGALRAAGAAPVLVVGGDRSRLSALGLDHVPDRHPGQGPLGGVITALDALDPLGGSGPDAVVTLPCDVKAPDPTSVRLVMERLAGAAGHSEAGPPADLVVPLGGGVPQWTHSGWHRSCLPRLSVAFATGVRALNEAARQLRTVEVEVPGTSWFADADRPEDLPPTTLDSGHTEEAACKTPTSRR
ncbi:MAG: molybdenum cofactor guanylyltransferase [Acidimicrobiaceae bacterium]|nr:molybdenum cofactor guanylyltransferase [Acidimicrobiaceae bacterium]MYH78614.1 molybdenum cofactor guanylyltransferase [Acidimicrobiaceae bacterium]MYK75798.1 molybdenum cofactor guanylyltransferase [Acidimicrobiaceae bacterium]